MKPPRLIDETNTIRAVNGVIPYMMTIEVLCAWQSLNLTIFVTMTYINTVGILLVAIIIIFVIMISGSI